MIREDAQAWPKWEVRVFDANWTDPHNPNNHSRWVGTCTAPSHQAAKKVFTPGNHPRLLTARRVPNDSREAPVTLGDLRIFLEAALPAHCRGLAMELKQEARTIRGASRLATASAVRDKLEDEAMYWDDAAAHLERGDG